jgi:hypothetical protein
MPKVRDILVHVTVEEAVRKRKCHRSGAHRVAAGEVCLVVREALGHKQYCRECAAPILDLAAARLAEIRKAVGL